MVWPNFSHLSRRAVGHLFMPYSGHYLPLGLPVRRRRKTAVCIKIFQWIEKKDELLLQEKF